MDRRERRIARRFWRKVHRALSQLGARESLRLVGSPRGRYRVARTMDEVVATLRACGLTVIEEG